jgi:hypothetical protein
VQILFTVPGDEVFECYSYCSSVVGDPAAASRKHVRQLITDRHS